jgi:hypothetical protein
LRERDLHRRRGRDKRVGCSNRAFHTLDSSGYNARMSFQLDALEEALRSLGAVLQQRRTPYRLLVVGGGSLLLLRLIDRPTGDLDVVGVAEDGEYHKLEVLPAPLATAAAQVAQALGLADNWLNTGPASLMDFGLPSGFEDRITIRTYGGLDVHIPSRFRPHLLQALCRGRPRAERQALHRPSGADADAGGADRGGTLDGHPRSVRGLPKRAARLSAQPWRGGA